MSIRMGALIVATTVSVGCSTAATTGFLAGYNRAVSAQQGRYPELLIFGGQNHDIFLGCLNCGKYDPASVGNQYGEYGNPYSENSILNKFGEFGNPYSPASVCNSYTLTSPVLVDRDGTFYGALTMNDYNAQRTRIAQVNQWLSALCAR